MRKLPQIKYLYPLLEQGLISATNFLMSILVVRWLSFELFSLFAIVQMVAIMFVAINQSLIVAPFQTLAHREGNLNAKPVFSLQLFFLLILAILLIFGVEVLLWFESLQRKTISLGALYVVALVFQDFYRKKFYVLEKKRLVLIVSIVVVFVQVMGVWILHFFFLLDLDVLLICLSVPQYVVLLWFLFKYRVSKPSARLIKQYWDFGKWLFYNALLQWFSGNMVVTIGVYFLGSFVAGIVRLAQNIVGVVSLLYQVVENIVPSKASFLFKEGGLKQVKRYLLKITFQIGTIVVFCALFLILFSKSIYSNLYGRDSEVNAFMLNWFAPLLFITFLNIPLKYFFRTIGETKTLFQSYFVGVIMSILSILLFILPLEIHAVGLSLIIGQLSVCGWFLYQLFNSNHELRHHTYSTR